jgi:diguanylate cyclase (GGDEF)-like protein
MAGRRSRRGGERAARGGAASQLAHVARLVEARRPQLVDGAGEQRAADPLAVALGLDGRIATAIASSSPDRVVGGTTVRQLVVTNRRWHSLETVCAVFTASRTMDLFAMTSGAAIGAAAGCAWQARRKQRVIERLARLSRTDALSGCLNRRGFNEELQARVLRHERYGDGFGLVLLDLDGFKKVNDRHGHAAGDELLRRTSSALCAALRGSDAVARLGGDEFGVLLDRSDAIATDLVARRLQHAVGRHIAASAGYASCPDDGSAGDALYRRADARLYEAKRALTGAGAPLASS